MEKSHGQQRALLAVLISPGHRRFSRAPHKALSGSGMLASYGTCSAVSMKVLSVLAVLFPLAGY